MQLAASMVAVLHDHREPGDGKQFRNGLLRACPIRDALLRGLEHRLLPLEDEQGPWYHHVPLLFCLRCRLIGF